MKNDTHCSKKNLWNEGIIPFYWKINQKTMEKVHICQEIRIKKLSGKIMNIAAIA